MALSRFKMTDSEIDSGIQKALEKLSTLGQYCKVDTAAATFHPEETDCEKVFTTFYKKMKLSSQFSSAKSIGMFGGRLLYGSLCLAAGLEPQFNAFGAILWEHGWSNTKSKCFHGVPMTEKINEIDMSATSEAGSQALKEGRGSIVNNKWGRPVVRVLQPNFVSCFRDNGLSFNQFDQDSCGLSFSDRLKATEGFANAAALTKAIFKKASSTDKLFMPCYCECNALGVQILGKQLPKMTPFSINGTGDLDPDTMGAVSGACIEHPVVIVFQCCNAAARRDSCCQFRLSESDALICLHVVRQLWKEAFNESLKVAFPVFKWGPAYKVKSAILPCEISNNDENPFGEPSPKKHVKKSKLKKRKSAECSDSENTESPVKKKKKKQVPSIVDSDSE